MIMVKWTMHLWGEMRFRRQEVVRKGILMTLKMRMPLFAGCGGMCPLSQLLARLRQDNRAHEFESSNKAMYHFKLRRERETERMEGSI
jgi:hypothetical protein